MRDKRGIMMKELIPWLIAAGIVVVSLIFYYIMSSHGEGLWSFLKNLFRFGGI